MSQKQNQEQEFIDTSALKQALDEIASTNKEEEKVVITKSFDPYTKLEDIALTLNELDSTINVNSISFGVAIACVLGLMRILQFSSSLFYALDYIGFPFLILTVFFMIATAFAGYFYTKSQKKITELEYLVTNLRFSYSDKEILKELQSERKNKKTIGTTALVLSIIPTYLFLFNSYMYNFYYFFYYDSVVPFIILSALIVPLYYQKLTSNRYKIINRIIDSSKN